MWVMLNDAFFSIVSKDCAPDELMVRARRPGDIEKVFPETAGKVTEYTASDYHYRARVKRCDIARALAKEVASITYSNFKSSVKDYDLHNAYMRVWNAMADLQPQAPYAGRRGRLYGRPGLVDVLPAGETETELQRLDRLTPFEEAHVFATGHMPDDDVFPDAHAFMVSNRSRKPKPAKKRRAKKNTRGR
jgi:hypothetical protein